LVLSWTAAAQQSPPAQEPEKTPPQKQPEQPPTLDELLGLTKPGEPGKPEGAKRPEATDPSKKELDRKLSLREAAEQFEQAIELMGETADRIEVSRDTGLPTQRMQEDIIRKLDQMIQSAEQNMQQSRSRSRSQRQQQQQQQQPSQSQQRQQSQGEPDENAPEPPPRQDGPLGAGAQSRGAAWGALPQRFRDALRQGDADKYSAWYRKWTEAYYKRLAEDAAR
jgi:hypothetical protein